MVTVTPSGPALGQVQENPRGFHDHSMSTELSPAVGGAFSGRLQASLMRCHPKAPYSKPPVTSSVTATNVTDTRTNQRVRRATTSGDIPTLCPTRAPGHNSKFNTGSK